MSKSILRASILALFLPLLCSCATHQTNSGQFDLKPINLPIRSLEPNPEIANSVVTPQMLADCAALSGSIQIQGFGYPSCVRFTKDAGKKCTDSGECDGACLNSSNAPPGKPATGTCATVVGESGCMDLVEQGMAIGQLCVD